MAKNVNKYIKEGEVIARNSLLILMFLAVLKGIAGLVTGIVVLYIDALSSLTDVVSLFASWIGLKLSTKTAKKGFQYGYYKLETFAALMVSFMILYLGYKVIRESINRLVDVSPGQYTLFGVGIVMISIIFSYRLSKKLMKAGENANSLSLIDNAKDKKMDVLSAFVVLGGLGANYLQIPYLEGIIGIFLSLFIIKVGLQSAKEAFFFLMDYWDDYKLLNKISRVLKKEGDLVQSVKKIRLRRAGTFIFGEAFLEINPFADMKDLRNDLNKLTEKVKEINPHIKNFILYEMIPDPKKIRIAIPIVGNHGLGSKIAERLGTMTHYMFVDIYKGKIKQHKAEKFTFAKKDDYIQIVELLKRKKVNILVNNDLNSLLYFQLQHIHHIQIYPKFSNIERVDDTIKLLLIDR
ncbi:MAG: cation diffusion facilitator family transporter [Patescibacteria group bacterium]|nr:cation diffusion facilitator family transporter [Patescibacteria group bacterium]